MSVKETFDKWYNDLPSDDKKEILSYILEAYTSLTYTTEGYHAGPSGKVRMTLDGIHAGPSGSSTATDEKKCPCCGK